MPSRPSAPDSDPSPVLTVRDGALLRSGVPHRLLAGSMHYFRVHPGHWADRLARLAALGLNAVDTYVAWNFHEAEPGRARFDGWRDVEHFIGLAGAAGLDVIVRPGPYICGEWDNGGLPAWLTARPDIRLRSSDPAFVAPMLGWFDELIPRLAALQAARGGPVVAVQVENEFGSFGDDQAYLRLVRDALIDRGITEFLYTADGPTERMQQGGSLPGVLAAATFGSKPAAAAALLRSRREGEHFLCAEFWNGWFDHWGERHHVRDADDAAETVRGILDENGSVSLYMAHGGSNFGLWAGANHDGETFQPTVTSYDSDAPIAENGALTEKFFAIRAALRPEAGDLPVPAGPTCLAPQALPVRRGADLLPALRAVPGAVAARHAPTFETLGLASGLVLYRTTAPLPSTGATLTLAEVRDRTIVFVDGVRVATLDPGGGEIALPGGGTRCDIEVLVENQGRINYGPLLGQGKGIIGDVCLDGVAVLDWSVTPLPIDRWSAADLGRAVACGRIGPTPGAGFLTADLVVDEPADAFLALPEFGKGFVWVGDFLLGRYWDRGPQRTLYVPGPLLRTGSNLITVLELDRAGERIEVRAQAELGPEESFVESFEG